MNKKETIEDGFSDDAKILKTVYHFRILASFQRDVNTLEI
ncbi:hypothetical protein STFR1_50149 [Bacillus vallismortis]